MPKETPIPEKGGISLFRIQQGEDTFVIDPVRLSEIEFPIYIQKGITAYYVPSGKNVFVPVKFRFNKNKSNDEKTNLIGEALLPKDEPKVKASCNMSMAMVCNAFLHSREHHCSLLGEPRFGKYADAIMDSIADNIASGNPNFIMMDRPYNYPSFVFMENELVGVSKQTVFREDEIGAVILEVLELKGPYISKLNARGRNIKVVILNDEGEKITEVSANTSKVTGDSLMAEMNSVVRHTSTAATQECQRIYDEYKENYITYFIDKEDSKESEGDFSGIFI